MGPPTLRPIGPKLAYHHLKKPPYSALWYCISHCGTRAHVAHCGIAFHIVQRAHITTMTVWLYARAHITTMPSWLYGRAYI